MRGAHFNYHGDGWIRLNLTDKQWNDIRLAQVSDCVIFTAKVKNVLELDIDNDAKILTIQRLYSEFEESSGLKYYNEKRKS